MLGQLIRYGIVGGLSSLIYSAIYWPLATYVMHPVLAVFVAFGIAVAIGYVMHSRWSFKGHGKRERNAATQARFVIVQTFGLGLNVLFTWVLTGPFHGPTWWPIIPSVTLTPLATYGIQRYWVFA
ncbi:MAG: polysaccharide synthesis protein GtrA [Alphaproteobacteria bacterium]|nr:polysaccharide synthesis protein GtrA [Alphaproteobacteria bacterium]MDB5722054.1 polysaccharide synthesis protein GtrA [Alphaproteobacteria bacterium]